MVKETELYDLLGCSPDADEETLKKAFRRAALKYHPDRFAGAPEEEQNAAQKKFAEINNAYDILKDSETRERYDRGGLKAVQEGGDDEGGGMGDFLSAFLRPGGRGRGEPKPKDIAHRMDVPLEEFYSGATRKIAVTRNRLCGTCSGSGTKSGKQIKCTSCDGQGMSVRLVQVRPGLVAQTPVKCSACTGTGRGAPAGDVCGTCDGRQVNEERKVFEVAIEKGMKHGDAVTFTEEGNQIPGVRKSGDVVVLLGAMPHPDFVRKGRALVTNATVPLVDALCGFQIQIKHLDGRILVINPLEGQVLRPDMTCLVSREGMPVKGTGGTERGDLVVHVKVEFPSTLTPKQIEQLRGILGPMTVPALPDTDECYETTMAEVHSSLEDLERDGKRATQVDEDDDHHPRGGPGMQTATCATQ